METPPSDETRATAGPRVGLRERMLRLLRPPAPDPVHGPCPECGHEAEQRFCSRCGLDRGRVGLDVRGVLAETTNHVVGLDSTLGRTLAALVRDPGRLVRDYVAGRRRRYVGPARLCLISLAAWFLVMRWLGLDPLKGTGISITNTSGTGAGQFDAAREFIVRHLDVLLYLSLPLRAALFQLFFRRSGRNLAESLVLVLYVASFGYVLALLFAPCTALGLFSGSLLRSLLISIWSIRAAHGFYGRDWWPTTWRTLSVGALHFLGTLLLLLAILVPWMVLGG